MGITALKPSVKPQRFVSYKLIVFFALLLAGLKAGPMAFTVVSGLLCLWALVGAKQAIQALSIAVIIKHLNPTIYHYSAEFGMIAWLLLLVAGLRLFAAASFRHIKLVMPLLLFAAVVALLIPMQANRFPEISAMKLFVFTYGASALIVGYAALSDQHAEDLACWFISLITAVILLSLPTLAFPAIAYARNGTGFQGIMTHPQTFGPMLGPLASWVLAGLFFTKNSKLPMPLALGVFLLGLMVLSEARTSAITVFLSLVATFLVVFFKRKRFETFRVGRALGLSLAAIATLAIGLASSGSLRSRLLGFVFKYHSANVEQALSSRSAGIESQWQFFLHEPLIGNGFGVYPWGEFPSEIVKVMGIPISAPVEKGFLPTAILEEIGLIGTLAFLYFIIKLGKRVAQNGDPRWLAVFFACLFVNVGEMVFFSLGGTGLYYWLMLGLSTRIKPRAAVEQNAKPPARRRVPLGITGGNAGPSSYPPVGGHDRRPQSDPFPANTHA